MPTSIVPEIPTRQLRVRVPEQLIDDLRVVTKMPEAAIARAGLDALAALIEEGRLSDLRIKVAEQRLKPGPKPGSTRRTS